MIVYDLKQILMMFVNVFVLVMFVNVFVLMMFVNVFVLMMFVNVCFPPRLNLPPRPNFLCQFAPPAFQCFIKITIIVIVIIVIIVSLQKPNFTQIYTYYFHA